MLVIAQMYVVFDLIISFGYDHNITNIGIIFKLMKILDEYIKKQNSKTAVRIVTEVGIIFIILLIFGLINKNFLLFSNSVHFEYTYPENTQVIRPITPLVEKTVFSEQNTSNDNDQISALKNQYIDTELAELSLNLPSTYQPDKLHTLKVMLEFVPQEITELSITPKNVSPDGTNAYQPIYNKALDDLDWEVLEGEDTDLWQKYPDYRSIHEFTANPPIDSTKISASKDEEIKAAEYFTEFNQSDIVDKLINKDQNTSLSQTPYMEGMVTAYTFVTSSDNAVFTIRKHDINYYEGEDIVPIKIYDDNGNLISDEIIEDDGILASNNKIGQDQTKIITLSGLRHKIVKIVAGGTDSYTKIITNQPYLVVQNSIMIQDSLFDNDTQPYTLYTNAQNIEIPFWHVPRTNQTLTINNSSESMINFSTGNTASEIIELGEPADEINTITLEKNHIFLKSADYSLNRYFSFTKESFFNPKPLDIKNLDISKDTAKNSSIKYILTSYKKPEAKDNSLYVEKEFTINPDNFSEDNIFTLLFKNTSYNKNQAQYKIISVELELSK